MKSPSGGIVSSMLSSMGYECHLAETAEETLGILAATQIDVALCGIFEWTVANFRPMIAKFPDVSVCVLTASQHIDMVLNPLGNGAYDFLLKPLNAINYCFWCIERWSVGTLKLDYNAYSLMTQFQCPFKTDQSVWQGSLVVPLGDALFHPRFLFSDAVRTKMHCPTASRPVRVTTP